MFKPATLTTYEKKRLEKTLISVQRNRNGNEVLTRQDSDNSEIDSDKDDGNDRDKKDHSWQQKKSKRE